MRAWIPLTLIAFVLSVPAVADQITLSNGDRLTGSISKSDGRTLVIKTDYAGEVTVKFDAIQSITSTGDLHVEVGGKTAIGSVSTSVSDVVVATKSAGPIEAPKAAITSLRSPEEQAAHEKELHPGWIQGWNGGVNVGFAVTRGNSQTKNLNVAFTAVRKGFRDKLVFYSNSIYTTNDVSTASPHTTANAIGGGVRYDHDFAPRWFGFVNADFFHDALQSLDLRSILGGGIGWHAIKRETTTLDFLAGINYTHESYSSFTNPQPPNGVVPAVSRNLAGGTLGDEFMHKLGASTVITQTLYFYPDLSDTGEYRGTFNFGTVTKINKWLGWQNSFGDIYVTNPPVGKKKNDLLLSTGLNISFKH